MTSGRTAWLLAALGVAVVAFVYSRTNQGQNVVAGISDAVGSAIRGIRNNNPLNVEKGQPWEGLAPADQQTDPRFAVFVDMPHGIRAAARTMLTYRGYGLNTVHEIIDRWNPKVDRQPPKYIPNVSAYMGVRPDDPIDVRDPNTMFALLRGMMPEEVGGAAALLVSDADVWAGIQLAGVA